MGYQKFTHKNKKRDSKSPRAKRTYWPRNYEHSVQIGTREDILAMLDRESHQRFIDLIHQFGYQEDDQAQEGLRRRLHAMVRDGQLTRDADGAYALVCEENFVEAIVHVSRGAELGICYQNEIVAINYRHMHWVFPGDTIKASVKHNTEGRLEAAVIEVLARESQTLIGRYHIDRYQGPMAEVNCQGVHYRVRLPHGGATAGQIVSLEITQYPERHILAEAKVTQVLEDKLPASMIVELVAQKYHLPQSWPQDVLEQIKPWTDEQVDTANLPDTRQDIRDLSLVTIDGSDAKDFDDAVFAEKTQKGWHLVVAIADVSHYVTPDSALDQEALMRSTSVYFPECVIPMLPEVLSNGLCSLKPHVDRLCLVCDMHITAQAKLDRYQFYPALMHSHARLTYQMVEDYLKQGQAIPAELKNQAAVFKSLKALQDLANACLHQRTKRGALEFNVPEALIELDDNGFVTYVAARHRLFAHQLIEECMLLANTAAAKLFEKTKTPCLYRVHSGLKHDAVEILAKFLSLKGIKLENAADPTPHDLSRVLMQAVGRPDEAMIQMMVLRTMDRALYQPNNEGHFGLAYDAYAHFTSPIRRYPDLLVHRALKYLLDKQDPAGKVYSTGELHQLGEQTSMLERRAETASREVISMLKCVYMEDKIGQTYAGIISGVTSFGFFVTVSDLMIDGLVHMKVLKDDYYRFDESAQILTGERGGRQFSMGQEVKILVARVDIMEMKIDFELQ